MPPDFACPSSNLTRPPTPEGHTEKNITAETDERRGNNRLLFSDPLGKAGSRSTLKEYNILLYHSLLDDGRVPSCF